MTVKIPLLRWLARSFSVIPDKRLRSSASIALPALGLKLALGAMTVQNEVWRRLAGEQRADLLGPLPNLARQSACLHLKCGRLVSVDNLPQADFASQCFRQDKCVERYQQPVLPGESVGVDESDWD